MSSFRLLGGHQERVGLVGAIVVLLAGLPARADTWVGDSLEMNVADADLVVRGALEKFVHVEGVADQRGTLRVKRGVEGDGTEGERRGDD